MADIKQEETAEADHLFLGHCLSPAEQLAAEMYFERLDGIDRNRITGCPRFGDGFVSNFAPSQRTLGHCPNWA